MYDLLFNVPWWIPTVLGIVGIALMVRGNRQQNERIRIAGTGVLLLGVGWAIMSYLVDTPKETCISQSRALVQSVVAKDWTKFDALLDPTVRFTFEGSDWNIDGKDRLDTTLHGDIDKVGVTSATVTGIEASDEQDHVVTQFSVLSAAGIDDGPDDHQQMAFPVAKGRFRPLAAH